jgi:hypothetical protein
MNKQREALDALEGIHPGNMTPMAEQAWNKAINAIREALVEPEPVSHHSEDDLDMVARKPLTDEQIDAEFDRECWVTVVFADGTRGIALDRVTARDFARAIERAHGIGD